MQRRRAVRRVCLVGDKSLSRGAAWRSDVPFDERRTSGDAVPCHARCGLVKAAPAAGAPSLTRLSDTRPNRQRCAVLCLSPPPRLPEVERGFAVEGMCTVQRFVVEAIWTCSGFLWRQVYSYAVFCCGWCACIVVCYRRCVPWSPAGQYSCVCGDGGETRPGTMR